MGARKRVMLAASLTVVMAVLVPAGVASATGAAKAKKGAGPACAQLQRYVDTVNSDFFPTDEPAAVAKAAKRSSDRRLRVHAQKFAGEAAVLQSMFGTGALAQTATPADVTAQSKKVQAATIAVIRDCSRLGTTIDLTPPK